MFSPLLEGIIERENYPIVDEDNMDEVLAQSGDVILFIAGEFKRLVEVNDAAVILPELIKASRGQLSAAVLDRKSETKIQLRYRFNAFPAFVFLRNGDYLGVITRVLDWQDYMIEIPKILALDPTPPPAYEFPDGCGGPTEAEKPN